MAEHPYLVRVDPDLWRQVKAKAKTEHLSLKALWERLLRGYLATNPNDELMGSPDMSALLAIKEKPFPMSPANQLPDLERADDDPLF